MEYEEESKGAGSLLGLDVVTSGNDLTGNSLCQQPEVSKLILDSSTTRKSVDTGCTVMGEQIIHESSDDVGETEFGINANIEHETRARLTYRLLVFLHLQTSHAVSSTRTVHNRQSQRNASLRTILNPYHRPSHHTPQPTHSSHLMHPASQTPLSRPPYSTPKPPSHHHARWSSSNPGRTSPEKSPSQPDASLPCYPISPDPPH